MWIIPQGVNSLKSELSELCSTGSSAASRNTTETLYLRDSTFGFGIVCRLYTLFVRSPAHDTRCCFSTIRRITLTFSRREATGVEYRSGICYHMSAGEYSGVARHSNSAKTRQYHSRNSRSGHTFLFTTY